MLHRWAAVYEGMCVCVFNPLGYALNGVPGLVCFGIGCRVVKIKET